MNKKFDIIILITILILSSANLKLKENNAGSLQIQIRGLRAELSFVCSSELAFYKEFSMGKEIWKDIPKYEGYYQISNFGRVKSLKRKYRLKEKILKLVNDSKGYFQIYLCKDNKNKFMFIHRLVLLAFVGKSNLECNHKNFIRSDNRLENLEYVTAKENIQYSFKNGRYENRKNAYKTGLLNNNHSKKKVNQYDLKNNLIATFDSLMEANKKTGIHFSNIFACCLGKYKTSGNFKWEFV
jgi:hypothetical protein